jgi:hypothetical protein
VASQAQLERAAPFFRDPVRILGTVVEIFEGVKETDPDSPLVTAGVGSFIDLTLDTLESAAARRVS